MKLIMMYSTGTQERSDQRVVTGISSNWDTRWHVGLRMQWQEFVANWDQADYWEHGNPFLNEKHIVGPKNLCHKNAI
jgi:hypothetical protein